VDCDVLKSLIGLECLALLGLLIPLFAGAYLHPAFGQIVAVWWWVIPGTPIPILHSFTDGWQPFVVASPWCLHQFLDADLHTY